MSCADLSNETGWERIGLLYDLRDLVTAGDLTRTAGRWKSPRPLAPELVALIRQHPDVPDYLAQQIDNQKAHDQ